MKKTRIVVLAIISCISVMSMGCARTLEETTDTTEVVETVNFGTEDDLVETEIDRTTTEVTVTENDQIREEIADDATEEKMEDDETIKDDMDSWIGKYEFGESVNEPGFAPMVMVYDINIYKENNQYYADVEINGHMTGINLRAKLYGNNEWVSLVINEYYPEHITGLSGMENSVILSLRRQGEEIYTYWGVMTPLMMENAASGTVCLERKTEEASIQTENTEEMDGLENWIGVYAFSETNAENEKMFYDMNVYEENGEYYANLAITGEETEINVKTQLYGDEQWASFILVGYNSEHKSGLEDMENEVLFSLRKQEEDIYTYWGTWDMTELMLNDGYLRYYQTHYYFEKVEE